LNIPESEHLIKKLTIKEEIFRINVYNNGRSLMKKSYLVPKMIETKRFHLIPCQAQYVPFTLTNQGSLFDECGGGQQSFTGWVLQDITVGANFIVTVTPTGSDIDIILRVLRPDNSDLTGCVNSNVGEPSGESVGPFIADQAGEYEIHVHNNGVGFGDNEPYSIFVTGTNDVTPTLLPQATAQCTTACPAPAIN
jgi:hypothetical protein